MTPEHITRIRHRSNLSDEFDESALALADAYEALAAGIREIHAPDARSSSPERRNVCDNCGGKFPCATIRLLGEAVR